MMIGSKRWGWALLLVLLSGAAHADTSIDTTGSWDGSNYVYDFGVPNTATYGQTITAPSAPNTSLNDFTFYINDFGTAQSLKGYVYAWNSTTDMAEGPALYVSSTATVGASNSFQAVTFNTGGIALVPGQQYVLFGSVSDPSLYNASNTALSGWGSIAPPSDPYSGGTFVYINNGGDESQWTTTAWDVTFYSAQDLAFKADFGPAVATPEPSPLTAVIPAILLSLGYTWTRRRKAAAV